MLNFLKLPKHSKFEYKPRFFDPDKEDLENRVKAAQGKGGSGATADRMRAGFKYRNRGMSFSSVETKKANKRVLIILVFLVILSYFLFKPIVNQFL